MPELKYEAIFVGRKKVHYSDYYRDFYQIQATRDIPEHGVKKGDLGGFVTDKDALDQVGSCWVGGQAQIVGKHVSIVNDAYIGDNALVESVFNYATLSHIEIIVSSSARITGNATVYAKPAFFGNPRTSLITDEVHIYGEAHLYNVAYVSGASKIYGDADIQKAYLISHSEIYDRAVIEKDSIISKSSVYGDAIVWEKCKVESSALYGSAVIQPLTTLEPGTVIEGDKTLFKNYIPVQEESFGEIFSLDSLSARGIAAPSKPKVKAIETKTVAEPVKAVEATAEVSAMMKVYREVCENIESYRNDVVKLIKYPVMTDQTNEHTLSMMSALKAVQRLEDTPDTDKFNDAVLTLENAFMKAESNARKIASTLLSEADRKKTEKAKDLFRVASNEASSEREKKNAFIQGFKQLEGVLDVPDAAVDAFRIKIGLPELEM